MNLVYSLDGDNIVSRPASEEELKKSRDAALEKVRKDPSAWAVRSCWVCNPAHSHFLKNANDGFLFQCLMGCGHWYYQGVDITNYDEKEMS